MDVGKPDIDDYRAVVAEPFAFVGAVDVAVGVVLLDAEAGGVELEAVGYGVYEQYFIYDFVAAEVGHVGLVGEVGHVCGGRHAVAPEQCPGVGHVVEREALAEVGANVLARPAAVGVAYDELRAAGIGAVDGIGELSPLSLA